MSKAQPWLLLLGISALALACGSDDADAASSAPGQSSANDQTPPTQAAALEAWLKTGVYKDWQCEPEVHESRSPSPHSFNRICTNLAISEHVAGDDPWPRGAAAVKELFASRDEKTPNGYAVYLKTEADSAGGASWYWYERNTDGMIEGMGDHGPAQTVCVGCHVAAGSDAAHTPSEGGRDQVYTPVMM